MTVVATQVAGERTPASPSEVEGAISAAWRAIVGSPAPQVAITMIAAQAAVETADYASMYNWNLGGITHAGGDNFDWVLLHGSDGKMHTYRAYASLDQGAADLVQLLKSHYAGALPAAERGDLSGYVSALKAGGYAGAGADYVAYQNGMEAKVTGLLASVVPTPPSGPAGPSWRVGLVAAAAAGVAWLAARRAAA